MPLFLSVEAGPQSWGGTGLMACRAGAGVAVAVAVAGTAVGKREEEREIRQIERRVSIGNSVTVMLIFLSAPARASSSIHPPIIHPIPPFRDTHSPSPARPGFLSWLCRPSPQARANHDHTPGQPIDTIDSRNHSMT